MKILISILVGLLVIAIPFSLINCGGKKEKPSTKEEPGLLDKAKNMAQGLKAVGKTVEAAKQEQDKNPVNPVNFRELLPLLPLPIAGWEATEKPSGSTQSYGKEWKFTEVQQRYTKGESNITIKITDGAYIPMIYTAFTFASSIEEDTTEHYQKGITIGEDKGYEEYNYNNKDGKLLLLASKRFIVEISGNSIDNTEILHNYLNLLDSKKLAAIAK